MLRLTVLGVWLYYWMTHIWFHPFGQYYKLHKFHALISIKCCAAKLWVTFFLLIMMARLQIRYSYFLYFYSKPFWCTTNEILPTIDCKLNNENSVLDAVFCLLLFADFERFFIIYFNVVYVVMISVFAIWLHQQKQT